MTWNCNDRTQNQTGFGTERRVDLYFVRPEGLCAIRHQSQDWIQYETDGGLNLRLLTEDAA